MAWKQDEDGRLSIDSNGNPIWVTDGTGEEKPVDYTAMTKRLSEVNAESKNRKEEIRTLKEKYALLADIEDLGAYLDEANKAIEMVKNAPDRDKDIEAQVQSRLEAVTNPLKSQIAAKDKAIADKDKVYAELLKKYHNSTIKTDVQSSKLLAERVNPDDRPFIQRELERAGAVNEQGSVYYRFEDGETIYGEDGGPAKADEAIIAILKKLGIDPAKKLMSTDANSGSGGSPNGVRGLNGRENPWKRETWNSTKQHQIMRDDPALAESMQKAAMR